jgi:K+-transporting ATPase KdpF subunit
MRRSLRREGVSDGFTARRSMFDYIISGIVSVLLLVYLGWAMFQPERF